MVSLHGLILTKELAHSHMPVRPFRVCTYAGCNTLTNNKEARCDNHPYEPWSKTADTKRISGSRLQKLRKELFARSPLCVDCAKIGRVSVATQRDHITPLSAGGKDIESNVQALCQSCHDAKTELESKQGRAITMNYNKQS
jgi:5-methylcytosine-specific restriction protein A